ncbi:MAG TPA: T9SS type A sorting domain-containing protein [Paludibacter sp.]
MKKTLLFALLVSYCTLGFSQSLKSPLMGWSSWNNFFSNINETVIKGQVDAMVSTGLASVGFKYINIDDGYFKNRNADGSLRVDSIKFPNGMKVVADYIHTKGLKAGIYSDAGSNTCGNIYGGEANGKDAGLYNHDQMDIDLFFKTWGYDFLKVDYCGGQAQGLDEKTRYSAIKRAINNTGRTDINYNVCRWQFPGVWVTTIADSWRIANDINNNWGAIIRIIDQNAYLASFCSKGHYNDMDMLEVGRGMTAVEDKSHFSMWCIMSSPLVLGNDLTNISQTTKSILTNAEVIAVNQDTTGLQAKIVTDNAKGLQVWAKPLNGKLSKERAVVLFNRTASGAFMSVKWKDLNLVGSATVRNLWTHTDLGTMDSMYRVAIAPHGVVMLKVVGTQTMLQETFEAEYGWINNFNLTSNQGIASVDTTCSGRAKAGSLGNSASNYIEFRDIYANTAGSYNLKITYISAENRTATMKVNGKDTVLTALNSGSLTASKTNTYKIVLKQGYNTIRFANTTAWLPDFDKIQLDLNKYAVGTEIQSIIHKKVKISPNPCNESLNIQSESPVIKVSIFSLTGSLLITSGSETRINLSTLKSGFFIAEVTTSEGVLTEKFIKE